MTSFETSGAATNSISRAKFAQDTSAVGYVHVSWKLCWWTQHPFSENNTHREARQDASGVNPRGGVVLLVVCGVTHVLVPLMAVLDEVAQSALCTGSGARRDVRRLVAVVHQVVQLVVLVVA